MKTCAYPNRKQVLALPLISKLTVLVTLLCVLGSCASVPLARHKAELSKQEVRQAELQSEILSLKTEIDQLKAKLGSVESENLRLQALVQELQAVIAIKDAAIIANASNLVQSNGLRIESLAHSVLEEPRRTDKRDLHGTGLYVEWDVPNQARYIQSFSSDYRRQGLHAFLKSHESGDFKAGLQIQDTLSVKLDNAQLASGKQRIELELRDPNDQSFLMTSSCTRFFTATIKLASDQNSRPAFRAVFEPDNNFMRLMASEEAKGLIVSVVVVRIIHKPGQTATREIVSTIFEGKLSQQEAQSCRLIYQTAADLGSLKLLQ